MDHLTKYYKNLSEQLQEKVNYYTKLIETYSTIMPDPEGRYPGRKPRNPSHWDEPTEEPDMSDWKYPHPMPRPSDSGVWEDGGGKFPSPKPYPYPGGSKEKMPPVKPPFIGKEKVPPTKPPFGKEKKPIKGELFDREHLMGESTSMSENLGDKIMKSFLKFLNEESESNKRELERINQDRKDEGKPPFKTLDQALTYYEKEDEKARRKKLRENREVSKAGDYDDSDLPSKGPKNFEIIDKIDGSMHSQSGETSTYLVRGDDGYHYTIAPRYGEAQWALDNEDIGNAPKTWNLGPKHRKTFDIVDRIDNVKNSDHQELMKRYKIEIPETPDYDSDPMSAEDAQNMRRNQPNHLPRSARDGGGVSAYYQ